MNQIAKIIIACITATAGFTSANGAEVQRHTPEQAANGLCQQAMTLYAQELAKNKNMATISADMLKEQCRQNIEPPEHWQCVVDSMNEGNSFMYSTGQCKRR